MPIYEPGLDRLVTENIARRPAAASAMISRQRSTGLRPCSSPWARRPAGATDMPMSATSTPPPNRSRARSPATPCGHEVDGSRRHGPADRRDHAPTHGRIWISMSHRNPEFLREGSAIGDFMRPDRVVIGAESDRAREVLRRLYRPLYLIEAPIVFTSIETAELTKYAANAFLAMKVTFINEIADLCERVGADVHDVARGIGLDGRIGRKFLHPGPGFGGSCFPKDTLALMRIAQDRGAPSRLVEAIVAVNDARKSGMAARIVQACGGSVHGKVVAVSA